MPPTLTLFNAFVDGGWPGKLTPTEAFVLLSYIRHAGKDGVAYPGNDLIAAEIGVSKITRIRQARARLQKLGLLVRVLEGGGRGKAGRYQVFVPSRAPAQESVASAPLETEGKLPFVRAVETEDKSTPVSGGDGLDYGGQLWPQTGGDSGRKQGARRPPEGREEGKTKEGGAGAKRRPRAPQVTMPPIPEVLNTAEFRAAWGDWIEYRREIKVALTSLAARKQLNMLATWGVAVAVEAINTAINCGWKGLFRPKQVANLQVRTQTQPQVLEDAVDDHF